MLACGDKRNLCRVVHRFPARCDAQAATELLPLLDYCIGRHQLPALLDPQPSRPDADFGSPADNGPLGAIDADGDWRVLCCVCDLEVDGVANDGGAASSGQESRTLIRACATEL